MSACCTGICGPRIRLSRSRRTPAPRPSRTQVLMAVRPTMRRRPTILPANRIRASRSVSADRMSALRSRRRSRRSRPDFKNWTVDDQFKACDHLVHPIQVVNPDGTFNRHPTPDINGWDTHALFQGEATWLRQLPLCPPCATPSTSWPAKPSMDRAHEDPRTCSNTVQVGNACWLSGTPNYATLRNHAASLRRHVPVDGDAAQQGRLPPRGLLRR